jgi:hypothetical protein
MSAAPIPNVNGMEMIVRPTVVLEFVDIFEPLVSAYITETGTSCSCSGSEMVAGIEFRLEMITWERA